MLQNEGPSIHWSKLKLILNNELKQMDEKCFKNQCLSRFQRKNHFHLRRKMPMPLCIPKFAKTWTNTFQWSCVFFQLFTLQPEFTFVGDPSGSIKS